MVQKLSTLHSWLNLGYTGATGFVKEYSGTVLPYVLYVQYEYGLAVIVSWR